MGQWILVSFMVLPLSASQGCSSLAPGAPGLVCLPLPTPVWQPLSFSAQGFSLEVWGGSWSDTYSPPAPEDLRVQLPPAVLRQGWHGWPAQNLNT